MKFSESWLREWVSPPVSRADLLERLTMAGLEVDGFEPVAGEFSGVVAARVVSCEKHPDAEKLSICAVDDGSQTVTVVCGAPNVRAGLTVAFARVGARLPGDFRIKKARLRGVESQGMLCSGAELALGEDADGILELPETLVPGQDLRSALDLDDISVDLDLTPNRGDCLSIRGLAREVGVLFDVPVIEPAVEPVAEAVTDVVAVHLDAPEACPRYLGRVLRDVDMSRPAPAWLREKLRRSGLRSIDPVVDVTNYVLMELGQPMHAFDLGKLSGPIRVRKARSGESLELLDGKQVDLDQDTLLITDSSGPVAMAGVMGGAWTGVGAGTRDILLECAFFQPLAIAGTARRYGLHTDASHRYERGVDFELQQLAMDRACQLLQSIVGGRPGPVVEAVAPEHLPSPGQVAVRQRRLDALLGVAVRVDEVDRALAQLGLTVHERLESPQDGVRWLITPPSHRFDIAREADLVEEICRIYGYDRIPVRLPDTRMALRSVPLARRPGRELKRQLTAMGYQEAITYSFVDPALQRHLDPVHTPLGLQNPMSLEQSVMRTTLLPGLVQLLRDNLARQHGRQKVRLRLFELGRCFLPGGGLRQPLRLGGLLFGHREPESWNQPDAPLDFFDLKGDVENLLAGSGAAVVFEPARDPVLHPGQSALVSVDGRQVGRLGRLHPELEMTLDCPTGVYLFELELEQLQVRAQPQYRAVSRFPAVRRDLAVVVDRSVSAEAVESVVRAACGARLVDFRLFDVYEGKGIDSNQKSLALGLTLQDPSATLTDAEINKIVDQAVADLANSLGATLR